MVGEQRVVAAERTPETRSAIKGELAELKLGLRLLRREPQVVGEVEFASTGGITHAKERGLPHASDKDLVDALFSDGLSTADVVSSVSGRGVGMGATRYAAQALGGAVSVVSKRGEGTTIAFRFPLAEATRSNAGSLYPGARPSIAPPHPPRPTKSKTSSAA